MTFDLYQLDGLEYDEAEEILEDYIDEAISEFVESPVGKKHVANYPEGGGWIGNFIEMGYLYGDFTLPKMTVQNVQEIMEYTLPRKLIIFDEEDVKDAIPELISFWQFLAQNYKLRKAKGIIKYLKTLTGKFTAMMMDSGSGGFLKPLLMNAHQSGVDVHSQEALESFFNELNSNRQNTKASSLDNLAAYNKLKDQELDVPAAMQSKYDEIVAITDSFCQKYLDDEYLQLSRKLTTTLCNCEPSPLNRGRAKSWACGIVHTLAYVNFLSDSSFEPYMSMKEFYQNFGVSDSTGSSKSKQIRDLLEICQMDPDWCVSSLMENNPLAQLKSLLIEKVMGNLSGFMDD